MKEHLTAAADVSIPVVKANYNGRPKYAVISVYDIEHQVGLVQFPENINQFYVIAPYYIFDSNMRNSAGQLVNL